MSKKVCVILGAGASADAWNNGGPILRNDHWRPPLARELFPFGDRPAFWTVAEIYPGVRVLASELGEIGATTLEEKLLQYAHHPDGRIKAHFREVPLYLRDLILAVTAGFTRNISPGNHPHLVTRLLGSRHQVAFLDLNYDDYVETALADFDKRLAIREITDYVAPEREVIVGKVHGSSHW